MTRELPRSLGVGALVLLDLAAWGVVGAQTSSGPGLFLGLWSARYVLFLLMLVLGTAGAAWLAWAPGAGGRRELVALGSLGLVCLALVAWVQTGSAKVDLPVWQFLLVMAVSVGNLAWLLAWLGDEAHDTRSRRAWEGLGDWCNLRPSWRPPQPDPAWRDHDHARDLVGPGVVLGLLIALGLALRAIDLGYPGWPFMDTVIYGDTLRKLAAHLSGETVLRQQHLWSKPLFILVTYLYSQVMGFNALAFQMVGNLGCGLANIVVGYLVCRYIAGKWAGLIAATLLALHPVTVYIDRLSSAYAMASLCGFLAFYYTVRHAREGGWAPVVYGGLWTCLALLTHPTYLVYVPLFPACVGLSALCATGRWSRAILQGLAATAMVVAPLLAVEAIYRLWPAISDSYFGTLFWHYGKTQVNDPPSRWFFWSYYHLLFERWPSQALVALQAVTLAVLSGVCLLRDQRVARVLWLFTYPALTYWTFQTDKAQDIRSLYSLIQYLSLSIAVVVGWGLNALGDQGRAWGPLGWRLPPLRVFSSALALAFMLVFGVVAWQSSWNEYAHFSSRWREGNTFHWLVQEAVRRKADQVFMVSPECDRSILWRDYFAELDLPYQCRPWGEDLGPELAQRGYPPVFTYLEPQADRLLDLGYQRVPLRETAPRGRILNENTFMYVRP